MPGGTIILLGTFGLSGVKNILFSFLQFLEAELFLTSRKDGPSFSFNFLPIIVLPPSGFHGTITLNWRDRVSG